MAQWSDYWRFVTPAKPKTEYVTSETALAYNNYTWYSQVIKGAGDRNTKYITYDQMDVDIDVARALDTIAEEMTTFDVALDEPLDLKFYNDNDKEIDEQLVITLRAALRHWVKLQGFDSGRLFTIARTTIKYGDCFFRKTSDVKRWQFIDPKDVFGIEVDDDLNIVNYHIRGKGMQKSALGAMASIEIVPAAGIVHFTLSDMMGRSAPFGESILQPIVKTFRQLKLMEDACVIYRISRAPERRVFYVDVGNLPAHKVKAYLESLKNDLRQKKMPIANAAQGKDSYETDAIYSAEAVIEDFFLAQPANGRGSRVETLQGAQNLGEIDDLKYFRDKLYRGLRIPSSYMSGSDAGGAQYQDGKVGVAYIEELRFANFVKRLQNKLERVLDEHFKRYLKTVGVKIHHGLFDVLIPDPQNFALYRQAALDSDLVSVFNQIKDVEHISKRFALKRYLHWSEEDIQINEALLKQELNIDTSANVPELQQIYDSKFAEAREAPKIEEVKAERPEASAEPEVSGTAEPEITEPAPEPKGEAGSAESPDKEDAFDSLGIKI